MLTLSCKSFRVRHDVESVVLEIDGAAPANLVPQLMSRAAVAARLQISVRKVAEMAQSGRLPSVRIDGSVRFKEVDVLHLLTENQGLKARLLALPTRVRSEE